MFKPLVVFSVLVSMASALHADEAPRHEQRLDSHTPTGSSESSQCQVESVEDSVFTVWTEEGTSPSVGRDIYLATSFEVPAGYAFGAPIRIDGDDESDDHSPILLVQEEHIVIAWLKRESGLDSVYVRSGTFEPGSRSVEFGAPLSVGDFLASDSGDSDHLRGAICVPHVYLCFEDDANAPGASEDQDGTEDVYVVSSSNIDLGTAATFGIPMKVNDGTGDVDAPEIAVPIPEEEGHDHGLLDDDDNKEEEHCPVYIVWGDRRNGPTEQVYFTRSIDEGVSFEANVRVDTAPDGSDADDIRIAAVEEFVFVTWNDNRFDSEKDTPFFRHSANDGETFLAEERLSTVAADIDSTRVGVAHEFPVFVAWSDDRNGKNDIFVMAGDLDLSPGPLFTIDTELDVDFENGLSDSVEPVLQVSEGAVGITYLDDTFVPGRQEVWMTFFNFLQPQFGWQRLLMSYNMPVGFDADALAFNLGDHFPWEGHVMWVDNRNGGTDQHNDVFVTGLRRDHIRETLMNSFQ